MTARGKLRLLVPLLALGGCGGTSAVMDLLAALDMAAPPPDFVPGPDLAPAPDLGPPDTFHWSCYGKPFPSTAPDPITTSAARPC